MAYHLTHLNERGEVHMVDVGSKSANYRKAIATGCVQLSRLAFDCLNDGRVKKGDVLATARVAGIMAAKKTSDLIPLCHPLALSKIEVTVTPDDELPGFAVDAMVRTEGRTGVEMEALTAVSAACLTLFDMLKAVDKTMSIDALRVTAKEGGRSGAWRGE